MSVPRNIRIYRFIRKVHLYASLFTVVFFGMYLLSGFVMMRHSPGDTTVVSREVTVTPDILEEDQWSLFLKAEGIGGKNTLDRHQGDGQTVREYREFGHVHKLTVSPEREVAHIESTEKDLGGYLNDLHRQRGYAGPFGYWLYAFMIDATAFSLFLFVATGIYLWLRVLPDKRIGIAVLVLGGIYVGATLWVLTH